MFVSHCKLSFNEHIQAVNFMYPVFAMMDRIDELDSGYFFILILIIDRDYCWYRDCKDQDCRYYSGHSF